MAKTTNLNIRIDPVIKEQAENLFSNFGMNISDAINIFLHQSLIYGGLPFNVQIEKPNTETKAAMKGVGETNKNGSGKRFDNLDDPFAELELLDI